MSIAGVLASLDYTEGVIIGDRWHLMHSGQTMGRGATWMSAICNNDDAHYVVRERVPREAEVRLDPGCAGYPAPAWSFGEGSSDPIAAPVPMCPKCREQVVLVWQRLWTVLAETPVAPDAEPRCCGPNNPCDLHPRIHVPAVASCGATATEGDQQ